MKTENKITIYYNHDRRTITDDDDNQYTYDEALSIWNACKVKDYNMAFITLMNNDGDTDSVERSYKQQNKLLSL